MRMELSQVSARIMPFFKKTTTIKQVNNALSTLSRLVSYLRAFQVSLFHQELDV